MATTCGSLSSACLWGVASFYMIALKLLDSDGITRVDHPACWASPLSSHGMCSLDAFLVSQAFSKRNGDWDQC